jgi:D-3-phosphoglycerate dehydrogenase
LCWTDQCFAGNGGADIRAVLDVQHGRVPLSQMSLRALPPNFSQASQRRTL